MPRKPGTLPESPHKAANFRKFKTVNTQPSRTALKPDEYAWLENLMPIGDANLPAVPGPDTALVTLSHTGPGNAQDSTDSGGDGGGGGTTEGPAITWNPADKNAAFTLSNSDKTATNLFSPPRVSNGLVRATTGFSTGKKYIEYEANCSFVTQYGALGLAELSEPVSNYPGKTSSWGWFTSGNLYHVDVAIAAYADWVSDNPGTFAMAVDFDSGKAWLGKQIAGPPGITWQGGGDPAAGSSPSFTFGIGITLYPTFNGGDNLDYATIVSRNADFNYSVPTGFTSWATP